MTYQGFRRPERLQEMVRMIKLYSEDAPFVVAKPVTLKQVSRLVDISKKEEGGQGLFLRLKDTKGRLGIKVFRSAHTRPDDRIKRAQRLRSALMRLTALKGGDTTTLLLFNILNIPRQYIAAPDGGLTGLLVPTAPPSCFLETEVMGRRLSQSVRIGAIISDRRLIPSRTSSADDPLPTVAKWSFLDSLCQAISSLHEIGLIHADISSSNVFVRWPESRDPKAYVIDAFNGFSTTGGNRELGIMRSDVFCPQSLRRGEYTEATDVYCLAWWIVHIAVTADPIGAKLQLPSIRDVTEGTKILYGRHKYVTEGLEINRGALPSWLFDILEESLRMSPADRPSSRELTYAVHDHWLNYGDAR